jgi:hypothetical protein
VLEAGVFVTMGVLRPFGDWVVVREGSFAVVSVTSISISRVERTNHKEEHHEFRI